MSDYMGAIHFKGRWLVVVAMLVLCMVCMESLWAIETRPPGIDAPAQRQTPLYSPPDPSIYTHQTVVKSNYGGIELGSYWIFEPDHPKPARAPIIVLIRGWTVYTAANYGYWIDHLVKQGNIVVYPSYFSTNTSATPFRTFTDNAFETTLKALDELQYGRQANGNAHVQPDFSRFSIIGHSSGGIEAPNVAARFVKAGLPYPRVIFSAFSGRSSLFPRHGLDGRLVRIEDLSVLPPDVLMVSMVGDQDLFFSMRDMDSVLILAAAKQIPPEQRLLYYMQSATLPNGEKELASHFTASAVKGDEYGPVIGANFSRIPSYLVVLLTCYSDRGLGCSSRF